MKEISIGENDIGKRLDNFLLSCFPKFTKILVCKLIRKKRVKVNNKRSKINYRLCASDSITVYVNNALSSAKIKNDDFLYVAPDINVVYEDGNILVVDKPAGVLCHPDKRNKIDCIINRIKKYLYEKGEYKFDIENSFAPSLVNRIDRNTQGLVISAKNSQSLKILNDKIKKREIKKYYKCLVHGHPKKQSDYLVSFLSKDPVNNKVYIHNKQLENSRIIKTKYEVLGYNEKSNISLLNIELITGRSHQIRAHLASIGYPIVGDKKYGKELKQKKGYQKLVAYKIKFNFESDAGILNYLNQKEIKIDKHCQIEY